MTKILFLAYHFPPIGGAGVQRNAKFARYLRDFGYEPVVVTGPGDVADRWTPRDSTLTSDVPAGMRVHRVPQDESSRGGRWRGRAERWFGAQTQWSRWWSAGLAELPGDVLEGAELVYASAVPYDAVWAAIELATRMRKPLVLDFQDPWALDEMNVELTIFHRLAMERKMSHALRAADAIVMNTPESRDRVLRTFRDLRAKRVVSITNGFDAADFAGAAPPRTDPAFRVVHTGYLHTTLGRDHRRLLTLRRALGGVISGVDILTRSHLYLVQAIERLRRDEPEIGNRIELDLAGVLTDDDRDVGAQSPAVRMLGYVSHPEAVALMRSADLLFLPMHELSPGHRVGITPGKTYEYIASGTPVLAAVPDGDVRDLLEAVGNAFVCRPADVDAMTRILREQVRRWAAGEPPPRPDPAVLARYERRHLTERLAALFDDVLGGASASAAA